MRPAHSPEALQGQSLFSVCYCLAAWWSDLHAQTYGDVFYNHVERLTHRFSTCIKEVRVALRVLSLRGCCTALKLPATLISSLGRRATPALGICCFWAIQARARRRRQSRWASFCAQRMKRACWLGADRRLQARARHNRQERNGAVHCQGPHRQICRGFRR